jgi:hypothetical protein
MEDRLGEELVHDRDDRGPQLRGPVPAPGRGAHEEGDLLGRVVGVVGHPTPGHPAPGLDDAAIDEDLDGALALPGVDAPADEPPGHRVERPSDLDVAVRADLGGRPGRQLEGLGRQGSEGRRLDRLEQGQGRRAVEAPVGTHPGDLAAPAQRLILHGPLGGPLAAGPERVADVGHRPFHTRLVPRLLPPRGVHEGPEVGGQIGVAAVDLRVVEVGAVDAGAEVVDDGPRRHPAEEGEGGHVRRGPGARVEAQHRAHEHVARPGEDHDEGPHPAPAPRLRVVPAAEVAVVDLGLLAGLGRRAGHPHPLAGGLVGELRPTVAAEAREAHPEAVLVAQPLMDRGDRVGLEHLRDALAMGRDERVREAAGPGVHEPGEPAPDQRRPARSVERGAAGCHPGVLGRGHVLAHRLDVQPEALRDDQLGPAGVPVLEHLHDIDHVERSPCHRDLAASGDARDPRPIRFGAARPGNTVNGGLGSYLNADASRWGIT